MNIAIVTGASSGMGREFVLQLSGYVQVDEIWVIARRADALENLKGEVSVPVRPISMDLLDMESFDRFQSLLEEEKPDIKLLVNAAGFGKFGAYHKVSLADDARMIDLNCKALVLMTRLCLPYMTSGSHILQLDSLSAFQPVPYITTYGATKSFVLSYSRAMNRELKAKGIHVMAVAPGWIKTEFFDHAIHDETIKYFDRFYTAKQVVDKAMKDLSKRKVVSILGLPVQAQVKAIKHIPVSLVMKIWCRQQGK